VGVGVGELQLLPSRRPASETQGVARGHYAHLVTTCEKRKFEENTARIGRTYVWSAGAREGCALQSHAVRVITQSHSPSPS